MITSFVEAARQHQTVLLARVAELREPATEPRGWWHEYIHGGFTAKSNYDWRLVDIEIDTNGDVGFINHAGKFEAFYRHCLRPSDVLDAATIINTKRADAIERDDLPQLARYISWQKRRINEWQLRPLYPVSQRVKVEAFV